MSEAETVYKVYSARFLMMALYGFLSMSNSITWSTFVAITDVSTDFFNASESDVNMLALVFSIFYIPGTLLGVLLSKKYGLRETLLMGGMLTSFGASLRLLGCLIRDQVGGNGAYGFCLVGQIFAAIGFPLFYNLPATISADWFPIEERDLAAALAVIFNTVGGSVAQVLSPAIASTTSDGKTHGVLTLMLVVALIAIIPTILSFILFRSKPPTPPSRSAETKDTAQEVHSKQAKMDLIIEDQQRTSAHSTSSTPGTNAPRASNQI